MKKIHSYLIKLTLALTLVFGFTSCDEGGEPDPGQTAIVDMSGDWVVNITREGEDYSHGHISTYNTSDDGTTQMWLDDNEEGWGLKAKVNLDLANKTFSGTDLPELYWDVTVTISEGKVIPNGATAPSGTVVDSITFNAVFSDIPDEVWVYSGYKRTGFLEDE